MKEIRCHIAKNGEFTIETVSGFAGSNCQQTLDSIMVGYNSPSASGDTEDAFKSPDPNQTVHIDI